MVKRMHSLWDPARAAIAKHHGRNGAWARPGHVTKEMRARLSQTTGPGSHAPNVTATATVLAAAAARSSHQAAAAASDVDTGGAATTTAAAARTSVFKGKGVQLARTRLPSSDPSAEGTGIQSAGLVTSSDAAAANKNAVANRALAEVAGSGSLPANKARAASTRAGIGPFLKGTTVPVRARSVTPIPTARYRYTGKYAARRRFVPRTMPIGPVSTRARPLSGSADFEADPNEVLQEVVASKRHQNQRAAAAAAAAGDKREGDTSATTEAHTTGAAPQ